MSNSTFGMTAASTSGSTVDYSAENEWKKYIFSCMKGKITEKGSRKIKERNLAGVVNLIVDLSKPQAGDRKFATKCALPLEGEQYSEEEKAYMLEHKNSDFKMASMWDDNRRGYFPARVQTSPSFPKQEFGIAVDFPSIMVDYSKHPKSTSEVEDLRPYRISLNGEDFNDKNQIGHAIVFEEDNKTKKIAENSLVYLICKYSGREQQLLESGNNISTLVQAVCNFKVTLDLNEKDDGNVFLNDKANTPSAIDDMIDPETDEVLHSSEKLMDNARNNKNLSPFCGILLNAPLDSFTTTQFEMIGGKNSDRFNYIARAKKCVKKEMTSRAGNQYFQGVHLADEEGKLLWEDGKPVIGSFTDTNFAKAYYAYKGETPPQSSPSKAETPSESKPEQVPSEQVAPLTEAPVDVVYQKGNADISDEFLEDDIPFTPKWLPHGKLSILAM